LRLGAHRLCAPRITFVSQPVECTSSSSSRIEILAAVAEDEGRRISERTKAALAAAKARGTILGRPANLTAAAKEKGALAVSKGFRDFVATAAPEIRRLRNEGMTMRQIAASLNEQGRPTRRGGLWTASQVKRIY
jgi:DNA invertase Pin-like site-specific DNA recombinase